MVSCWKEPKKRKSGPVCKMRVGPQNEKHIPQGAFVGPK